MVVRCEVVRTFWELSGKPDHRGQNRKNGRARSSALESVRRSLSEMLLIIRHIRIFTQLREQPAPHTCHSEFETPSNFQALPTWSRVA